MIRRHKKLTLVKQQNYWSSHIIVARRCSRRPALQSSTLLSLVCISCIILLARFADAAAAAASRELSKQRHELHDEELLRNPIVFDLNSLYKRPQMVVATGAHNMRFKRFASANQGASKGSPVAPAAQADHQQVVDACQSKMDIITPYYATNSKGKLRTIVNSELMQQAIQVETCVSDERPKCNAQPDCGCEQKYKWHRLLVLDPKDSGASRGLFMDWFLYPSACVCRCKSNPSSRQFMRTIKKAPAAAAATSSLADKP